MSDRQDLDLAAIRQALQDERDRLTAESAGGVEERKPVELDQQSVGRLSRMDALQVQAMAKALEARRHGRMQRIDAALKRLDNGDYGYCHECDEEISARRLAADPTVALCIDCAA